MATVRRAVRVVLIDPADRVLLLRFRSPAGDGHFWITVGGGIDPGENDEQAARREVAEEVGLPDLTLGPRIWKRRETFTWIDQEIDQIESFYLARVAAFEPHPAGHTDVELTWLEEMRWWTLAELEASTETFYPRALARHLRELLERGAPAEIIDVGV